VAGTFTITTAGGGVSPARFLRSLTPILLWSACSAPRPEAGTVRESEQPGGHSGYVGGAGGVRLFYQVDSGGPDTVVVLHGGPGLNLEGLRPDLRPLARRHTLVYFDQRGSGRSEMPDTLDLTAALMVEDVEAVRQAFHLDKLTLVGHSWGGGLALLYAAQHPDRIRRLVLVGPVPPRLHPYFDQYLAAQASRHNSADNARAAHLDSLVAVAPDPHRACRESNRIFLRGVAASAEVADRIKADLCAGTSRNVRSQGVVLRRVWASIVPGFPEGRFADLRYDWRPLAGRVTAPTLVVHGDQDALPLAGSEEWVRALPAARLLVIPDAGHYPHAEQPARFFPAVEAFLDTR
jgi:proline iminopeptidase